MTHPQSTIIAAATTTATTMHSSRTQVYLCFDERMSLHKPIPSSSIQYPDDETDVVTIQNHHDNSTEVVENSSRIMRIHESMLNLEERLLQAVRVKQLWPRRRFVPLDPDPCTRATIELVHTPEHYDNMLQTAFMTESQLRNLSVDDDLYFSKDTFLAASLAAGGVCTSVDAVLEASCTGVGPTRAIALVRPPGHHALRHQAMGFCYFNNCAIAAKHAIHSGQAKRVFVLDWDIHHGNGIQDTTYDDPNIFYLSIHRGAFENNEGSGNGNNSAEAEQWFYPGTGRHDETGTGAGTGTNLNIVWPIGGMGNTEYAAAFSEAVLPVVSAFNPDLIIVACGLDAAKGDTLGDCGLTPDMFYIMTNSLLETLGEDIPFVAALEGGYDLDTISACMEAVALSLLDEPYWKASHLVNHAVTTVSTETSSSMDATVPTFFPDEMTLSRYWNRDDQEFLNIESKKKRKTLQRALSAIRKSVRALASKGTMLGNMRFIDNNNNTSGADYRFFASQETRAKAFLPRNHRPCQQDEENCLPLKKRRLMVEMEAASKLLAVTHKCY